MSENIVQANENIINFEQEIVTAIMVVLEGKVENDPEYLRYLQQLLITSREQTRKWDGVKHR
ncbi:hypothetical protein Slash_73 [Bacillus phage Slash]|uniref:Uncharacterized protein n=2 Tax=Slashvirus TaxID=1921709 RepID=U5Q1F5_9CAUD|nr:hypothetical protein Staley_75 [Bacillus phage Staley]YP_008771975.1 hypothetical protein Slash_73 [Bacillus phage Slash]AGY48362.1 hypothetical protein Slash_73 [Bacillus phage Slash]AGY48758.1 hypothetical protein Staley_75 [Bacillus phage Staley]